MLLKSNLEKLKSHLKTDNVLATLEERYCYATDASNLEKNYKTPDLVVFVESIEDVQKVLSYAHQHEIPVVSRGAGTNMVGACTCTRGGIVLNFSKMNKILDINTSNMTARVQPGVILGTLKSEVEKLGLFYPPDPSNYRVSTVGGSIAQSSGGALAFKYGTTKDYVLSLKVVKADGTLLTLGAETSKDSSGYHLVQLMVGSEGTLAVVVEATLKLIPKPQSRCTVAAYFDGINDAVNAVDKIISAQIFPSAIDFMDKNSIITVENFLKSGLKTQHECMLLIELDGSMTSVNEQFETVKISLESSNAEEIIAYKDDYTINEIWRARHSSYAAATRLAPDVISDDIIVPRSHFAEMINCYNKIAKKYNLNVCLVGHVGDGNIHPQVVLDLDNEEDFRAYNMAKIEIYEQVKFLSGAISAEHGIGLEKKSYLENTIDKNSIELMRGIKNLFDPKNILNPDKIFSN